MKNKSVTNNKRVLRKVSDFINGVTEPSIYILLFGLVMSIILCLTILSVYYFACDNNSLYDSMNVIHALYDAIPAVLLCSFIPAMLWDLVEREIRQRKK